MIKIEITEREATILNALANMEYNKRFIENTKIESSNIFSASEMEKYEQNEKVMSELHFLISKIPA